MISVPGKETTAPLFCNEEHFLWQIPEILGNASGMRIISPQCVGTSPQSVRTSPQSVRTSPQRVRTSPQSVRTSPQSVRRTPQSMRTSPQSVRTSPQSVRRTLQSVKKCEKTENPPAVTRVGFVKQRWRGILLHQDHLPNQQNRLSFTGCRGFDSSSAEAIKIHPAR